MKLIKNTKMKHLIKAFVLLLVTLSLFSCKIGRPISKMTPGNNETYKVEYLFEYDGCKVYRFQDSGHYVYFTNCYNIVSSIEDDSTQIRVNNIILKNVQK